MSQADFTSRHCDCWAFQQDANSKHIVHMGSCPKHPLYKIKQEHQTAFAAISKAYGSRLSRWGVPAYHAPPTLLEYLVVQQTALNARKAALQRKLEGVDVLLGTASDASKRSSWSSASLGSSKSFFSKDLSGLSTSARKEIYEAEGKMEKLCWELSRVMDQIGAVEEMIAEENCPSMPCF